MKEIAGILRNAVECLFRRAAVASPASASVPGRPFSKAGLRGSAPVQRGRIYAGADLSEGPLACCGAACSQDQAWHTAITASYGFAATLLCTSLCTDALKPSRSSVIFHTEVQPTDGAELTASCCRGHSKPRSLLAVARLHFLARQCVFPN